MKIIDFEKKGNVVRFYLGEDGYESYTGDDWNDVPYECNAGKVYPEYVAGYREIVFPFDATVLEPHDGAFNSRWCKDDMKARKTPCILVSFSDDWHDDFDHFVGDDNVLKYYFGDKMEPGFEVYKVEKTS